MFITREKERRNLGSGFLLGFLYKLGVTLLVHLQHGSLCGLGCLRFKHKPDKPLIVF